MPEGIAERIRSLPEGMDFLIRPVRSGMCRYESLKDGTLTLEDVLIMNVYMDNESHNRAEIYRVQNGKHS